VIVVGTPTRGEVLVGYTQDLVALMRATPHVAYGVAKGTYLSVMRNTIAKGSIDAGATHVLFIDSDMRFPADAAVRLLAHEAPIVGANYVSRTQGEPTVRKDGEPYSSAGLSGLEEVDAVATGMLMIDTDVFKALPFPWFLSPWNGTEIVGEDMFFCAAAKQAGIPVVVDHDLKVGHVGETEFWEDGVVNTNLVMADG
jgi:hypothetical protein